MYGISKIEIAEAQAKNKILLLDIDVQGALLFQESFPDANFIAILPPSIEILRERLKKRGTESVNGIHHRINHAEDELRAIISKKETFNFKVVNGNLDLASNTLITLTTALYA